MKIPVYNKARSLPVHRWFAWHPVVTQCRHLVWLRTVWRKADDVDGLWNYWLAIGSRRCRACGGVPGYASYVTREGTKRFCTWCNGAGFEPPAEPLAAPAAHGLPELLRELKWSRPAAQQRLLLWLADLIEREGVGTKTLDEIADELGDPANWWKNDG